MTDLLEECKRTWLEWSGGEMPEHDKEILVRILTLCAGQLYHGNLDEQDFTAMIADAMKAAYNLGKATSGK